MNGCYNAILKTKSIFYIRFDFDALFAWNGAIYFIVQLDLSYAVFWLLSNGYKIVVMENRGRSMKREIAIANNRTGTCTCTWHVLKHLVENKTIWYRISFPLPVRPFIFSRFSRLIAVFFLFKSFHFVWVLHWMKQMKKTPEIERKKYDEYFECMRHRDQSILFLMVCLCHCFIPLFVSFRFVTHRFDSESVLVAPPANKCKY